MKQIKLISSFLVLLLFISCTENSNSLVNPEENLEKKGISQVTGGGDLLTVSCVAYNTNAPAVIASHVVTISDIITSGGGPGDTMNWSVYSSYTGYWNWVARVYVNETPPEYPYPVGNPVYEGMFGDGNITTTISGTSAGDVIYLWVWADIITGPPSKTKSNILQKLTDNGTGTLHLAVD